LTLQIAQPQRPAPSVDEGGNGGAFGDAGRTVVIEEGLAGPELSILAVCDGVNAVALAPAQDFKRALDADAGPNTGGMGAYSPVPGASADVGRGENAAKKCQACHTFGKGEPNRVGPNLWGVVGRPKATGAGFNYSAAMKSRKGNWTPEDLDVYLTNPRGMVPGTNMTFAGIPRGKERADVITYLNSKSDKPVELPKQAAAAAKHHSQR